MKQTAVIVALLMSTTACQHYSCYGVQFNRIGFKPQGATIVAPADEAAHASLAWVAGQVVDGKQSGEIDGRVRMDDFYAYARERKIDLSGVPTPTFLVRGVPVTIRGINNCM